MNVKILQSGGRQPDILQWAQVKIVSDEQCEKSYHDMGNFMPEGMICAMENVSTP